MSQDFKVFNKYRQVEEASIIKKIIHYCSKSNYVLSFSNYNNFNDILKDADRIRYYGNEPSVRRAIRLLNKDNKLKNKIHVIMSAKCKSRLDRLEQIKKDNKVKFKITKGEHRIIFE
tara:strand:- start:606 stop:956 length:351 start_codon:yes stop_codon:yes gene_type:complete